MGLSAYAQVNVTFQVDMSVYQKYGNFHPTSDSVLVAGDFNSWSTSSSILTAGTGADSALYSIVINGVTAGAHSYKFIFLHAGTVNWENDPNRSSTIGTSDTTLPKVFFNNLDDSIKKVWFKVDMSLPLTQGKLTLTDTVAVTGDFTGWGTSGTGMMMLTKGASDSVYSGLRDSLHSGQTVNFKFIYLHNGVNWEDGLTGTGIVGGNRTYLVPANDSSTYSDYWDQTNPNVQTGSGTVNFTIDMSVLNTIGLWDNTKDSVEIRGGFNGWGDADPSNSRMAQDIVNPNQWFISINFTNEPFGNKPYKYYAWKIKPLSNPLDSIWIDPYERPIYRGGDNRQLYFHGTDVDTSDYYDGIKPDWVIPSGSNLQVKFTVDMTSAMDPLKQAIPFDPTKDTLYYISEEPIWALAQGWYKPTTNYEKYLRLTNTTGNLYSGTYAMKDPSFNAFEYRYAWQKGSDGTWVFEPDGLGTLDTYRVRFIGQDVANHFPVNPWTMPTDTWTNNAVKTDIESNPYQSYKDFTGLKSVNTKPISYSLSQNYPNPFNPSTIIKFSIQNPGFVNLKIYNILGQEVATLVNEQLSTGSYSYTFDASRLSSGIYFYTIRAGNFVQSKKMILLK